MFSKHINEITHSCPQGEVGIKGEKGMRGLWGQVVIYHYHIHYILFTLRSCKSILMRCRVNRETEVLKD